MAQVAISTANSEWGSITVAEPALEEHSSGLTELLRRSPYASRFPESLDHSNFATTIRYREGQEPRTARQLPEWWSSRDRPLVYMTFGTVMPYMSIAADVYGVALEAVADMEIRVLLTVGRHFDLSQLQAVPDNVRVEQWVDQQELLGEVAAVVCHGGSGTVFGALAAGIPQVIVPIFADQFENGRRISRAGAAALVEVEEADGGDKRTLPSAVEAPGIRQALEEVLRNDSYRHGAQRISAEMMAAPLPTDVLDQLLTRARLR